MVRSLDQRPEMQGWTAWCGTQRRRLRERLAANERRRSRMKVGVNYDMDGIKVTELSDPADNPFLHLEIRK
jgi:hypothetical protein